MWFTSGLYPSIDQLVYVCANWRNLLFLTFFFKFFFLLMWTIFKVFIEFVTILLLFYVLVFWLRGMWDLSSLTRDSTHTPWIGMRSLNPWTTREALSSFLMFIIENVIFLIQNLFRTFLKVILKVYFVVRNTTSRISALGYLF